AHPSQLKSRITAILESGIRRQRASRIAVAALLSLIAALGLFVATLQVTALAAMTLPAFASPPESPTEIPAVLSSPQTTGAPKLEGIVVKLGTNNAVPGAGVELSPVSGP